MSKKRKTREEKIKAVQRNLHIHSQENSAPVYSISSHLPAAPIQHTATPAYLVFNYSYVTHDMMRTFIITSILMTASVAFFFLLQNHIIHIATLGY